MQLHYNILWIDNDLPDYEARGVLDNLNSYLFDLGFKGNIIPLYDDKDLNKYLDEIKFDLIISDYELDNTTGIKVVEHIRDKYLTEILFYTAKTSQHTEDELRESLKNIDRITIHLGRETLLTRIEGLIRLTIDKLLELNATRGLITSETSELDVVIESVVMSLVFDKLKLKEEKIEEIINTYVKDFLEKSPASFLKKYKELGFKNGFHRIEAKRKWHIFRNLLGINPTEEVKEFLKFNKTYGDEVIGIRNKFAHSKAITKDEKLFLAGFGPEGETFECGATECISIRKKLIEHRDSFNKLLSHLGLENS